MVIVERLINNIAKAIIYYYKEKNEIIPDIFREAVNYAHNELVITKDKSNRNKTTTEERSDIKKNINRLIIRKSSRSPYINIKKFRALIEGLKGIYFRC